jgi:hypothetical protein
MRARKDEHSLIGICQQNLLILPLGPRVKPNDSLLPLLDLFYRPASICPYCNLNFIAKRRDITHCPTAFQLAAQLTNNKARSGFHGKETRLGFDDQTMLRIFVRQIFTLFIMAWVFQWECRQTELVCTV